MKDYLILIRCTHKNLIAQINPNSKSYRDPMNRFMKSLYQQKQLSSGDLLQKGTFKIIGKARQIEHSHIAEDEYVVAGYMLIKALGMEEAVEILKFCPILDFQGEIEIREVSDTFFG